MSLGGLIGAALKGGGEGYAAAAKSEMEQQQKMDYQAKYMQMLEEKERHLAEFQSNLKVGEAEKMIPLDVKRQQALLPGELEKARQLGSIDVDSKVALAQNLSPIQIATARGIRDAENAAETQATIDRGSDKDYLKSFKALNAAKETPLNQVQTALAQIQLGNAKRLDELRAEFGKTADPARKEAIRDEVMLLSGKDKEDFMPVPLKDEMGNVTGYKIFDKHRGNWIEPKGDAAAANNDPLNLRGSTGVNPAPATNKSPISMPGRPLYDTPISELQRRAARPRGVSTDEAREAQAEIDARQGESRMSAF
jgi:hypothetical protein